MQAQRAAQAAPLVGRGHGDADPAGLAGVDAHRAVGREAVDAVALHRHAVLAEEIEVHLGHHQVGLQDRHLQPAWRVGGPPGRAQQRGAGGDVGGDAGQRGGLPVARGQWRAVDRAGHLRQAGQGLNDQIAAAPVAVIALPAEPGQVDAGDARLRAQRGGGGNSGFAGRAFQGVALAHGLTRVFTPHHQIDLAAQGAQCRCIGHARQQLLAGAQVGGIGPFGRAVGAHDAGQALAVIQRGDAHRGAGIGQQAAAIGAGGPAADLQHLDAAQRQGGVIAHRVAWVRRAVDMAGVGRFIGFSVR